MKLTLASFIIFNLIIGCKNQDKKIIDIPNDLVLIQDSVITINTESKEVKFEGTPSLEEGITEFKYLGYNPRIEFHAVSASFWEETEVYLIDNKTAKTTTIWNFPTYSPNDSLIACLSQEYGLEGIPNGFQVWKLSANRTLTKIEELDQKEWVPRELIWLDNSTIQLKITPVQQFYENGMPSDKIFINKVFKIN
ncbi:hypothetical protein AB8P51_14815 [Muriicola sp. SD30]|uniref:hypothetical protein n=1 Tax=Muriicola sp. SD30 TaxID=3240936 RepID=UPI003510CA53